MQSNIHILITWLPSGKRSLVETSGERRLARGGRSTGKFLPQSVTCEGLAMANLMDAVCPIDPIIAAREHEHDHLRRGGYSPTPDQQKMDRSKAP